VASGVDLDAAGYADRVRSARQPIIALAIAIAHAVAIAAAAAASVAVHIQQPRGIKQSVHVSFRAHPLPEGGYYYAVLVLAPYKRYTRASPPPCSTSSNMQRTDYGYPHRGEVALALTPAHSTTGHWCPGGTYSGAIYAVPHAPPCKGRYPCRSEPYEPPSPCWHVGGRVVCGVVALPRQYRYPDGLPAPLARGTTIRARFSVEFPR
jgi:hypothetical protein